jgi:hypothetical protein
MKSRNSSSEENSAGGCAFFSVTVFTFVVFPLHEANENSEKQNKATMKYK